MKEKEKELFFELCSFKKQNRKKLKNLLSEAATPMVLGQLFFNRMQGIAFGVLKENNLLNSVNREFRNSLQLAYYQNKEKNESFFHCIKFLTEILKQHNGKYAMLKGALLCSLYPVGYRTSNDIDLLVRPKDVTDIGDTLISAGFRQGSIVDGNFKPATRKEIIESKMTRGETVPYIKEINLPGMRFLEVDINFSLDYKPGDIEFLDEMMNNTQSIKLGDLRVRTLRADDFFVHLCSHLYKEATTLPWVEMMRDMTLYKYCDIYMLLNDANKEYIDFLFERAMQFDMGKVCAFAVLQTVELFKLENPYAVEVATNMIGYDVDFIHRIVSPKDKKQLIFTQRNIIERFFADNRKTLLEEVDHSEEFKHEA